MVVMAVLVWRRCAALLLAAELPDSGEGEGPPGPDPLDLPGDGLSPWDLFLRDLPDAPVDDVVERAMASL